MSSETFWGWLALASGAVFLAAVTITLLAEGLVVR
jgi:hypothetical protein